MTRRDNNWPSTASVESVSRRPRGFMIVAGTLAALITILILYPLGATFVNVFFRGDSIVSILTATIREPHLGKVLWSTAVIVGGSVFIATIIGATLAWLSERSDASMGWVTRALPKLHFICTNWYHWMDNFDSTKVWLPESHNSMDRIFVRRRYHNGST